MEIYKKTMERRPVFSEFTIDKFDDVDLKNLIYIEQSILYNFEGVLDFDREMILNIVGEKEAIKFFRTVLNKESEWKWIGETDNKESTKSNEFRMPNGIKIIVKVLENK